MINTFDIFSVIQKSSLQIYSCSYLKSHLIQKLLNRPLEKVIAAQGARRGVDP